MAINKRVKEILKERFKNLLENGAFPSVNYRVDETGKWVKYSMIEYSTIWSQFVKTVNDEMLAQKVDPVGVWTKKWNKNLLDKIREIAYNIGEDEVKNNSSRYRTIWD